MYIAIRKISRAAGGDRSELLGRLLATRARWEVPGDGRRVSERISTRPLQTRGSAGCTPCCEPR